MQCGHWMEKTDKGTTHRKGIPQRAPISPGKHLSAQSRPMDRKKRKNILWEYEIGGRRVRSRTSAEASSNDSWTNQIGRPKPRADIEIGNQRRIPAIRKTQTKAEDHKIKHNKASACRLRKKSESIRIEWRQGKRATIFEPASSKQQRLFSRCALACSLGV